MSDYRILNETENGQADAVLPTWLLRNSRILKALSHCQVMVGLVTTALSLLYMRDGALAVFPIGLFAGFYYTICGFIGICGSASYRRGLIIAYFTMLLHSIFICVPMTIVHSVIAFYFDAGACQLSCEMKNLMCRFTCLSEPIWGLVSARSAQSIDVGHIVLSVMEVILASACCVICCVNTCESFGKVDRNVMVKVMDYTMIKHIAEPIEDADLAHSE